MGKLECYKFLCHKIAFMSYATWNICSAVDDFPRPKALFSLPPNLTLPVSKKHAAERSVAWKEVESEQYL